LVALCHRIAQWLKRQRLCQRKYFYARWKTGCICSAGRPHATAEKNIMYTYIVLLKGINVGGHKKVPMAALRDILSRVGFENVKTYIQRSEERRVGKECESGWGRENRRSRT